MAEIASANSCKRSQGVAVPHDVPYICMPVATTRSLPHLPVKGLDWRQDAAAGSDRLVLVCKRRARQRNEHEIG